MKNKLTAALAIALIFISASVGAQPAVTSSPGKVRLIFLGTRYFSDVDVIKKGLSRSPYATRIAPVQISQRHIEYEGILTGPPESLIADVSGLAQNRYDVESRYDKDNTLIVTLRKIQAPISPIAPTGPAAPQ